MDRSLALGATGGSLSTLFLRLLSEALHTDTPSFECPLCPEVDLSALLHLEHLDIPSLLLGILIGLLFCPCCELVHLVRQSWRCWIQSRLAALSRKETQALYKLA